jgi:hypothetical protein
MLRSIYPNRVWWWKWSSSEFKKVDKNVYPAESIPFLVTCFDNRKNDGATLADC